MVVYTLFFPVKVANRSFEAFGANRLHVMKIGFFSASRFARIDSPESPRFALRIARPSKVLGAFWNWLAETPLCAGKKKNSININFSVRISRGHS